MKLAVMQPYFFPYVGYFQLIAAVDTFVIYDDVNFRMKSWINRNALLVSCRPWRFAVPLRAASQNRSIRETMLAPQPRWRERFLKTAASSYRKAPFFGPVFAMLEATLAGDCAQIGALARDSIERVMAYLGMATRIVPSSSAYANAHLRAQDRILDICRQECASDYYNLPGGRTLYDPAAFEARGVRLHFIEPRATPYRQFDCGFVPGLSVIDVLMFNGPAAVRAMLADCAAP